MSSPSIHFHNVFFQLWHGFFFILRWKYCYWLKTRFEATFMFCLMPTNYFSATSWSEIPFCTCYMVLDWLFWIIIFCYIIIVNFVVFHRFQFSNDLLFNKSISSIESSVQKKTAQEMTKDSNTYNSFKLENCQPSTVSGHHFLVWHLF